MSPAGTVPGGSKPSQRLGQAGFGARLKCLAMSTTTTTTPKVIIYSCLHEVYLAIIYICCDISDDTPCAKILIIDNIRTQKHKFGVPHDGNVFSSSPLLLIKDD